jgi:non-heme chloroperoxidase
MSTITTNDGAHISYKDWGSGQPIVFSHGWPLSADDWDAQMIFFASRGFRCIAHDRRGHGRSSQTWDGNDMDTYADDLVALTEALDLKNAIHVGHSTGGGEVARYIGRHGAGRARGRVAKAVLIGAVPPLMLKTAANPGGLPLAVFDDARGPGPVLPGHPDGVVLRVQLPRREGVPGHHRQLVAAGDDVRGQGGI